MADGGSETGGALGGGRQPPVRDAVDFRAWPWLAALPVLPLLAAMTIMQVMPGTLLQLPALTSNDILADPDLRLVHMGDLLAYSAVAFLHSVVCLGAIVTLVAWLRGLPKAVRSRAKTLIGIQLVILLVLVVAVYLLAADLALVRVAFRNVCVLLSQAPLGTGIAEGCEVAGVLSPLVYLAWLPTFAGMGIVIVASSLMAAATAPLGDDEETWKAGFALRSRLLQRGLYLLSTVLVTSLLTFVLFAHLPVGLVAEETSQAALTNYAGGLSAFMGVLFTLTLVATVAAPGILLFREARLLESRAENPVALHDWLQAEIFVSTRKQLINAAVMLAPLLAGPVGSLLEKAAG